MTSAVPWISLGIALLALAVNSLSFVDRRKQDRRDLFVNFHERMTAPELQEGREVIYERCGTIEAVEHLKATEKAVYRCANRALVMFDAFAILIEDGHIDRDLALREWGHSTANFYRAAQPFLAFRETESRVKLASFRSFGERAAAWSDSQL